MEIHDHNERRRCVLVTGSGSGIGAGIAGVLAERGWRVGVNDLDRTTATATAERIGGVPVVGDVGAAPEEVVDSGADRLGALDALVCNAGIHRRAMLADVEGRQLDEVYAVNLRAVILGAKAATRHLPAGGAIVNVSSIAAFTPQMGAAMYSASKAGVSAFTAQAAVEFGPLGIRVNAVAPGMVRTAMAEAVYADPDLYERRRAMVPAGRIGTPEDIGRAVAFLIGDDASYVNGQTLVVDGGFTNVLIDQLPHPG